MKKFIFLLFLVFLHFYIALADVPQTERDALIDLYNSTNGASWTTSTNWNTATEVSTWFGVTVEDNHVVAIHLPDNNLDGSIPSSIEDLEYLEYLNLSENSLSGPVPVELYNIDALKTLVLNNNTLTGPFTSGFLNLSNLETFIVNDNDFSGSILDFLVTFTDLKIIYLHNNEFTGSIPSEIEDLEVLEKLRLDNNHFSGTIPTEIGNLSNLVELRLSQNEYSGNIPSSLGDLTLLEDLYLDNNQFSGAIPFEIGNLSNLIHLYLQSNELTGEIPEEIGNLTELVSLNLSVNQLSGDMPEEIFGLSNLKLLALNNNQLTGSIPNTINYSLSQLPALTHLFLNSNLLTGGIPANIGDLDNLEILNLSNNQFSGDIPDGLGDMEAVREIYLNNNLFTAIPAEIGNLALLEILYLNNNEITSIPMTIGDITLLRDLRLNNNLITGTLPIELGGLDNLELLYANDNQLDGLPDYSGEFPSLLGLFVQNNRLGFEDIVPNLGIPDDEFIYSPQAKIGSPLDYIQEEGTIFLIQSPDQESNNSYTWMKNNVDLGAPNSPVYSIASIVLSDEGIYTCEITNSQATELTLLTESFTLTVIGPPNVETLAPTNISQTFATGRGNIISDRGAGVTDRGICWSVNPNPTTADNVVFAGSGTGTFSVAMSPLTSGTVYHIRAFGINSQGISYGNDITLTTLTPGNISKEYDITITKSQTDVDLDGDPNYTPTMRRELTKPINANTPSNFMREIGKLVVKQVFDAIGAPGVLTGIVLTALDWWGYCPLQIQCGLTGDMGVYIETEEATGANLEINYPVKVIVEYPQPNTFSCGEEVTIKTSYYVGDSPNMFTMTPPRYATTLGAMLKNLALSARFRFCLPEGPCIPTYYPCGPWYCYICDWCEGPTVCFPPAVCTGWYGPSIPLPDLFNVSKDIITICPDGFDNPEDLFGCASGNEWINAFGSLFGYTVEPDPPAKPEKICLSPPPFPTLPFPELEGCFSVGTPDDIIFSKLDEGRRLVLSGTKEDLVTFELDLISLLDYLCPDCPFVTSLELGPSFSIDLGDFAPSYHLDQLVNFELVPDITMSVNLGGEMNYRIYDPATDTDGPVQFGQFVEVQPGKYIKVTIPEPNQDPMPAQPNFEVTAELTTTISDQARAQLRLAILQLEIVGWEWTAYEKILYNGNIGSPAVMTQSTITLNDFDLESANDPFYLDPMKPRIDITDVSIAEVANIGGGKRLVKYKVSLKNNGDVPLSKTKLIFDLETTFSGSIFSVTRIECQETTELNSNFNGKGNKKNLLANGFILGVGEEINIFVDVEIKPTTATIDENGCFVPVTYQALATSTAWSPPTLTQLNGILIEDSHHTCLLTLYDDMDPENYPLVADVDLGAAVIDELEDFTIYGGFVVKLDKSLDLSKGNVGCNEDTYFMSLGNQSANAPLIWGDIHTGKDLRLSQSKVTIDYAQIGQRLRIHDAISSLTCTGTKSLASNCPSLFDLPTLAKPNISSNETVVIRNGRFSNVAPGDYKLIQMESNSVLKLRSGTYNISELKINGGNATVLYDLSDGPITLNLIKWTMNPVEYFYMLIDDQSGRTEDVAINYFGNTQIRFRKSVIHGVIIAPNAEIYFDNRTKLEGACYAYSVLFGPHSQFIDHQYIQYSTDNWPKEADMLYLPEVAETILLPNYPDPFDDETSIEFVLQDESLIKLGIYDITGRKVVDLVNESLAKGMHNVKFRSGDLSSGVYFYILEAKDGVYMDKMTVMRSR